MAAHVNEREDVIVQMQPSSVRSNIQGNNLEKYLDYIKERETDYCIGQEEVKFIQTGIENLVQTIYDRINMKNERRIVGMNENCILKVGSFYEGTKNKFPDEFDFIFVLEVLDNEVDTSGKTTIGSRKIQERKDPHTLVMEALHENLVYSDNTSGRKIYFKKYVDVKGPASKLMFIYERDHFKHKTLHVDIVPSYKIVDPKQDISVQKLCSLEPFRDEILQTGSYLLVGRYGAPTVSFTQTEVHFMKNILSKKHLIVYKLLKYILGGHGDAEIVRGEIKGDGFSTYMIKTAMIRQYYECENMYSEEKGPCVLTVLQNLLRYKGERCYPLLTSGFDKNSQGITECLLEKTLEHLRYMQKSTNKFNLIFWKFQLTPVGTQRLEIYRREMCCKKYKCFTVTILIVTGGLWIASLGYMAGTLGLL